MRHWGRWFSGEFGTAGGTVECNGMRDLLKHTWFCHSTCTRDKNSEVPQNKQIGKDDPESLRKERWSRKIQSQKEINAVYIEFVLQVQSRHVLWHWFSTQQNTIQELLFHERKQNCWDPSCFVVIRKKHNCAKTTCPLDGGFCFAWEN